MMVIDRGLSRLLIYYFTRSYRPNQYFLNSHFERNAQLVSVSLRNLMIREEMQQGICLGLRNFYMMIYLEFPRLRF